MAARMPFVNVLSGECAGRLRSFTLVCPKTIVQENWHSENSAMTDSLAAHNPAPHKATAHNPTALSQAATRAIAAGDFATARGCMAGTSRNWTTTFGKPTPTNNVRRQHVAQSKRLAATPRMSEEGMITGQVITATSAFNGVDAANIV